MDNFKEEANQYYYIDDNILGFYSPDIEYNNNSITEIDKVQFTHVAVITRDDNEIVLDTDNGRGFLSATIGNGIRTQQPGYSLSLTGIKINKTNKEEKTEKDGNHKWY
jgi:hypothetical protein